MTKGIAMDSDYGNTEPLDVPQRHSVVNMNETYEKAGSEMNDCIDGCCNGRENADDNEIIVCGRHSSPNEQDTIHYAEILRRQPCEEKTPSVRRTRESENPILRISSAGEIFNPADSVDDKRSKIVGTQDDFTLYENMRTAKHERKSSGHEKIHHSQSDSEIVYQNTSDCFNDSTSHVYENFEGNLDSRRGVLHSTKSCTSNETSETESLYEDLDDIYEAMTPPVRSVSNPIDIVYTSVDFSGTKSASPFSVGSCTNSSPIGSIDRSELRRCASYCYGGEPPASERKPPELPHRTSGSFARARPRSLHLGNQSSPADFGLGLYTGTLVGCCIVTKTSPKSIQKIIGDYLAREKKEHSKPVSFDLTTEFLCLSLNCAPWNLLAENSVDDIGCVTTCSANNKTALGYTISKPGEDTRLYVLHCSDADQIKDAIVQNFKRPVTTNSLSRWSSMSVIGTPRSRQSRSLPRMSTPRTGRNKELASFDDLVYLGTHKVKKSFLVVNDNISSVLDHKDSNDYTVAKIELYKDAIHLKNSRQDRLLDIHQLEWILSMGLFDEDRRYFGYISSKAFQGSKTRTSCHVFRCNRVGLASLIMETIRQACQATYLARTCEYPPDFRSRTNSNTSSSSEESISSNSETMSMGSTSSSPPEVTRVRRRPGFLAKRLGRKRMTTIQSFAEEDNDTGIETLEEETLAKCVPDEKPNPAKYILEGKPQPKSAPTEVPRPEQPHSEKCPPKEKANTEKCRLEEKPEPEIRKETTEKRFSVYYLISTIVSPPLKGKHVKECLKQYQKNVDKAMKKTKDHGQHYKKAQLVLNSGGIMVLEDKTQTPQAFYERASISGVQSHPDGKCAFAFTTVSSGYTKHKCHLFLQDKDPIGPIMEEIKKYIS